MSVSGAPGERREKSGRKSRPVGVGRIILAIVVILFLCRAFLADIALVQGKSMLPGLKSGDLVLIFKAAYGLSNPRGGYLALWSAPRDRDIVAAVRPDTGKIVIKRVRIEEGAGIGSSDAESVSEASFFLLGDNKYESVDSREFGPVPMNNILGRVIPLPGF